MILLVKDLMKWRVLRMGFRETAKRYIEKQGQVKCCACGKDLYSCDDFECSKSGKNMCSYIKIA